MSRRWHRPLLLVARVGRTFGGHERDHERDHEQDHEQAAALPRWPARRYGPPISVLAAMVGHQLASPD